MDLGLGNKIALVMASSQGIGLAVAAELANEGARVAINARGDSALIKARAHIAERTGTGVFSVAGDVTVAEDIERIFRLTVEEFGRIDILVTNSGGPKPGGFENLTAEDWEEATRGLLTSVIHMTGLVLPGMKSRGWGRILNVTSIAAKQPVNDLMLSNSLRAAVTGFAKSLALEVAEFGITVNTLLPGYTATERVEALANTLAEKEGVTPADIRARWESEIPIGRLATPEEFAALVAFLASERASYITGSSIAVDGGWIRSLL